MVEENNGNPKRLPTFLRRLLIERPPGVEEENYPNYVPFNFGAIFAAIYHFGLLILFFILDVTPLFLFNFISVSMWVSLFMLNRKGYHFAAYSIMVIELLLHQALCVIIIGWGTGFQYWILLLPIAIFLLPPGRLLAKIFIVLCCCLEYSILEFFYRNGQPLVDLGNLTINIFNYVNIVLFFSVCPIVVLYFASKMNEAQKALRNEQGKVAQAYSLLSKYVPPQLADVISNGNIDSIWKHSRKKLTLFFSDIKDFTSITDNLEPEDMANVLNEYLTEMNIIINEYKGTLAQVIGDGLYIIFGAPKSSCDKDHALRCVKMAIDMQRKMNELNKKWFKKGIDEILQIRCGINTGMATVGGYGSSERKEYTAMGMQTNIAARLEQTCKPGSILISHTTWALVNDEVSCSEEGKITVKGLQRHIRAYKVSVLADP